MNDIPGYTHRTDAVSRSPVSLADFEQMKASVPYVKDGDF